MFCICNVFVSWLSRVSYAPQSWQYEPKNNLKPAYCRNQPLRLLFAPIFCYLFSVHNPEQSTILYFFLSGMINTITPGSHWSPQFFSQVHFLLIIIVVRCQSGFLRDSASSFHWLNSSIFRYCSFGRSSRIRDTSSPLYIWCFTPYKPYIFCEDMILATCQCHSLLSWA